MIVYVKHVRQLQDTKAHTYQEIGEWHSSWTGAHQASKSEQLQLQKKENNTQTPWLTQILVHFLG